MMKVLFRILAVLIGLLLLASAGLYFTGNEHLFKAIGNTYLVGKTGPGIFELEIFETRILPAENASPYPQSKRSENWEPSEEQKAQLESIGTTAFLIVQDDSIRFERYWESLGKYEVSNSFSVAKSVVGLSVAKAIDLGLIKHIDQRVIEFIPELRGEYRDQLTIRHLLEMSSGMNFDESYGDPFGFMAKAYYGDELLEKTLAYEAAEEPGMAWKYLGGNTILLSIILQRTSAMTLSEFVSKHFVQPLGMETDAYWSLDDQGGMEKAYCCLYSCARDFSRFGKLLLDSGKWNGTQVLSQASVNLITNPATAQSEPVEHYGRHWWKVDYRSMDVVYARGILGQYIIVIPKLDMVVVRLGHKRMDKQGQHPMDLFYYLDMAIDLAG